MDAEATLSSSPSICSRIIFSTLSATWRDHVQGGVVPEEGVADGATLLVGQTADSETAVSSSCLDDSLWVDS